MVSKLSSANRGLRLSNRMFVNHQSYIVSKLSSANRGLRREPLADEEETIYIHFRIQFQNFPRLIGDCDTISVPVSISVSTLSAREFQNFPRLIGDCDASLKSTARGDFGILSSFKTFLG